MNRQLDVRDRDLEVLRLQASLDQGANKSSTCADVGSNQAQNNACNGPSNGAGILRARVQALESDNKMAHSV
jgi:hypothetical protein